MHSIQTMHTRILTGLFILPLLFTSSATAQTTLTAERLPDPTEGVQAWRVPDIEGSISTFTQIGEHLWAGGENGLLMHSRDGVTWTRLPTNDKGTYRALVHRPSDHTVVIERFIMRQEDQHLLTFRVNPDGSPVEPLTFTNNKGQDQPARTMNEIELVDQHFWGSHFSPADVFLSTDGLHWERSNFRDHAPRQISYPKRVMMTDRMAYLLADHGAVYGSQDGRTWTPEVPPHDTLITRFNAAIFGRHVVLAFGSQWGGWMYARQGDLPWAKVDPFEGRTVVGMAQRGGWALAHAREARKRGPGEYDGWMWLRHAFFLSQDGREWIEIPAPEDANLRVDATDHGFLLGARAGRFYRVPTPDRKAQTPPTEERFAFHGASTPLRLRGWPTETRGVQEAADLVRSAGSGDVQARRTLLNELNDIDGRFHRNTAVMTVLLEGMGDEPEALYQLILLRVEDGRLAGAELAAALERAYNAGSAQAGLDLADLLLDPSGEPTDAARAKTIYEQLVQRTDGIAAQAARGLTKARIEIAMSSTDERVLTEVAREVIAAEDATAAARLLTRMAPMVRDASDTTRRAFVELSRIEGFNGSSVDRSVHTELTAMRIAMARVADTIEDVHDGIHAAHPTDKAAYRELLEKAAGMGDPEAMLVLGDQLLTGTTEGFAYDPSAAETWFRKAGQAGHAVGARITQTRDRLGRPLPNWNDPITNADPEMLALLRALATTTGPLSDTDFARLVDAAWKNGVYSDASERVGWAISANKLLRVDAGGEAFTFHRSFRDARLVQAMLPAPLLLPATEELFQVAQLASTIGPIVFVLTFSEEDAEEGRYLLARSLGQRMMTAAQQNQPATVTELVEAFRSLATQASSESAEVVRQGLLAAVEIIRKQDASLVNDDAIQILNDPEAWKSQQP